jgi:hypothetical protein
MDLLIDWRSQEKNAFIIYGRVLITKVLFGCAKCKGSKWGCQEGS